MTAQRPGLPAIDRSTVGVAAAVAAIGVYLYFHPANIAPRTAEGLPAPGLVLTDLSGQKAALGDYKGKVVLLDFWATWCDACKEEMPDLKKLYAKLHPQGLEFLAPSMDEDGKKVVVPFVAENSIPWRVLLASEESVRAWSIYGLPTKFLIDRNGAIAHKYVGAVDTAEIERDAQTLLKKENTAS
ncbi:MAG: TlpA family protein disulfide reductase [Elusimicrobia bacterium]|nr:TlpA family protein disulfide reductase [Elusimicrobiota bacterium]